jgi:hypothetical protein
MHNLIIGDMYLDVGGTYTVRKVYHDGFDRPKPDREELAVVNFTRKGWFTKEAYKCEGEVSFLDGDTRKKVLKIFGNWNDKIYFQDLISDSDPEQVWEKTPLPENWRFMYGLTHFAL